METSLSMTLMYPCILCCRFIPGHSASGTHFQAYLLDGVTRWNAARAQAAVDVGPTRSGKQLRVFDTKLQMNVNSLMESVFGKKLFDNFRPPGKFS